MSHPKTGQMGWRSLRSAKGPGGRFVVIRDPAGAVSALYQAV